jgi:hypothetical protein
MLHCFDPGTHQSPLFSSRFLKTFLQLSLMSVIAANCLITVVCVSDNYALWIAVYCTPLLSSSTTCCQLNPFDHVCRLCVNVDQFRENLRSNFYFGDSDLKNKIKGLQYGYLLSFSSTSPKKEAVTTASSKKRQETEKFYSVMKRIQNKFTEAFK